MGKGDSSMESTVGYSGLWDGPAEVVWNDERGGLRFIIFHLALFLSTLCVG